MNVSPYPAPELERRYAALGEIMAAASARLGVDLGSDATDPLPTEALEAMARREAAVLAIPDRAVPGTVEVPAGQWAQLVAVRDCVVYALTREGDDVCWMDLYVKLAELAGLKFDPRRIDPARLLANCREFVAALHAGRPYVPDRDLLLAEVKALQAGMTAEGRLALWAGLCDDYCAECGDALRDAPCRCWRDE